MDESLWWALQYAPTLPYRRRLSIATSKPARTALASRDCAALASAIDITPTKAQEILRILDDANHHLPIKQWQQLLDNPSIRFVALTHPAYPKRLRSIPDPPLGIWIKGQLCAQSHAIIAIVGSRKPSADGIANTAYFVNSLMDNDIVIISGLAYGIDAAAHRSAMDAKLKTYAVLGSGINAVYPARHNTLSQQIIQDNGALISEYPPDANAMAWHFPERNRVISGLADAVLVIEATIKSGSLITARHAADQGRDVFAVPGSITSPLRQGCHQLIKEGALLADNKDDLKLFFGFASSPPHKSAPQNAIEAALAGGAMHIDKLVDRCGLTYAEVSSMLAEMELAGRIARHRNGLYYLRQRSDQ